MWLVLGVIEKAPLRIGTTEIDIDMDWADGMIGVTPVFSTKEAAEKYAGDRLQIVEVEDVE